MPKFAHTSQTHGLCPSWRFSCFSNAYLLLKDLGQSLHTCLYLLGSLGSCVFLWCPGRQKKTHMLKSLAIHTIIGHVRAAEISKIFLLTFIGLFPEVCKISWDSRNYFSQNSLAFRFVLAWLIILLQRNEAEKKSCTAEIDFPKNLDLEDPPEPHPWIFFKWKLQYINPKGKFILSPQE